MLAPLQAVQHRTFTHRKVLHILHLEREPHNRVNHAMTERGNTQHTNRQLPMLDSDAFHDALNVERVHAAWHIIVINRDNHARAPPLRRPKRIKTTRKTARGHHALHHKQRHSSNRDNQSGNNNTPTTARIYNATSGEWENTGIHKLPAGTVLHSSISNYYRTSDHLHTHRVGPWVSDSGLTITSSDLAAQIRRQWEGNNAYYTAITPTAMNTLSQ